MACPGSVVRGFLRVTGMLWSDLLAAFALVLVIEGIMPFISPATLRRMSEAMAGLDDRTLRITGLLSMLAGIVLLNVVRG